MSADPLRGPVVSPPPVVLLGSSSSAKRLDEDIRAAAASVCVLVEGEAGLDFGEVARAIHHRSGRPGPCVVLDCGGAESPAALESALARARGGTLYLDDLSELPDVAQARLARVARAPAVPLIAGLSVHLDSDASSGRLRREIVRRFARARVTVPSLRRRAEDIPAMLDAVVSQRCHEAGLAHKHLTQAAVTVLAAMPWQGNLAELRHAVGQIVGGVDGDRIDLADVLAHVRFGDAPSQQAPTRTLRSARQQFEREYIVHVLRQHRGRVGDAARALGIERTNLYRKARQLGISVSRPVHQ